MGEINLPRSYSGEMHQKTLNNLVKRYKETNEAVYYKKAAINMDDSTASKCLKFFWECGLLEREKQGYYVPPKSLIDFIRGVGPTAEEGKEGMVDRLKEDDIFSELDFLVRSDELEKSSLAENVAGQVGVDKDNIDKVERYIEILVELDILGVSEEEEIEPKYLESDNSEDGETEEVEESADNEHSEKVKQIEKTSQKASTNHKITLDITMDITEMDEEEIEDKLAVVNEEL